MQKILAQIGSFCLFTVGIFVEAEIFILYAGFGYQYQRGLNKILVLLIGGIPIAMPTVLSVTLTVGATQLAKYKVIITQITAIEGLAGVTIFYSDKTGTLTTNKLTIDHNNVKTFDAEEVILFLTLSHIKSARCRCRKTVEIHGKGQFEGSYTGRKI